MLRYPVKLEPDDNGTVRVSFPDIPEAHTFGVDRDDPLRRAEEALEAALSVYIARRLPIPTAPRPRTKAMPLVGLPTLSEAKVALYCAMRDAGVRNADLARRLGWPKPQIDRLLDLDHTSRMEQLEAAFRALDKRLTLVVEDAA